ncbi:MAG TPA: flagellar biosynthetic protein FliO [Methyloradius sp.]
MLPKFTRLARLASSVLLISMVLVNDAIADSVATPATSALKMILGLAVVLGVMALIAWALKRMTPIGGSQTSVAKIVGGVNVGTRERVVVIEIADRWIVVGVAPGQVNAIADIAAGSIDMPSSDAPNQHVLMSHPFAKWLKKSLDKSESDGVR